jgi:hypothetical protein
MKRRQFEMRPTTFCSKEKYKRMVFNRVGLVCSYTNFSFIAIFTCCAIMYIEFENQVATVAFDGLSKVNLRTKKRFGMHQVTS